MLSSEAQTFLQLEKSGSFKVERFYEGAELIFQLEGDEQWYEETIEEIFVEDNLIHFSNRVVSVSKIIAIRDFERTKFFRSMGNKLLIFAGTYAVFSVLATLVGWEINTDTAIIGGSAVGLGLLFKWIFKHKTWKIKGRKRLRVLSLDLVKPSRA